MSKKHTPSPMTAMLEKTAGTTRFHMPGHKGRLDSMDTTELARTDDLYAPARGIAEAERLAAQSCGAARTILLTGGSTAGLMAMVLSMVAPGETLLLARDVHHAVISACIWGDIDAVFADDLMAAMAANPGAKAVLFTHPDYYGVCPDIGPLVQRAHENGMLALADEAHGAHFSWWDAPQSAGLLGVDAWVQSAHKTLPALTGAAWLHLSDRVDPDRARRFLRMVQTSSPPFPILQSLDEARAWMDLYGRDTLRSVSAMADDLRAKIETTPGYENVPGNDPTRLVIATRGRGHTGLAVQAKLAEHFIDIEMADLEKIVCICTVADAPRDFARLFAGLRAVEAQPPLPPLAEAMPLPGERVLRVRQAALARQASVPLERAAGWVAGISAGMYPPGIPLILPGERITAACAGWLADLPKERRFGVDQDCISCVEE